MTRAKLMTLLEEYGRVAIYTYLVIWLLTMAGFAVAISLGVEIESAKGGLGLLGTSWLAAKLTQPLRIAATLALTPVIAALLKKMFGSRDGAGSAPTPPAASLKD